MRVFLCSLVLILGAPIFAETTPLTQVKGFNLSESQGFPYDAAESGQTKTPAQNAVDEAQRLGANHIILNVRATMKGPRSTEIIPVTPPAERGKEAKRIIRLIRYIQSKGLTVGLRPIFFVVGPNNEFPYFERQPDGTQKLWWHGNIQPSDPNRWFESFRVYLDFYMTLAKAGKVDEFTIGAELYSLTVGIEDQWKEHPYGFPGRWLELLRYTRTKLPEARLMYDINFTDDDVSNENLKVSGGEFERWRYRIVDLADRTAVEEKKIWTDLTTFWSELDAIGIDMYRSLATASDKIPTEYSDLLPFLRLRTDSFATQIDTSLTQISLLLGLEKPIMFKELGFRSVENGFIEPFTYSGSGKLNIDHQAAAFEAIYESFLKANWPWMGGINWWEVTVDPSRVGPEDKGFSPIGKPKSEEVIQRYWK